MSEHAALIAAARKLIPAGVGLGWADPQLAHPLLPGEILERAVPKRQCEFSAGRAAARLAMGLPDQPLPMRPDRTPLWPDGICGSISHSNSACLAVAAPLTLLRGLGLDLEPALPLDRDLWQTVLTPTEQHFLACLPEADRGLTAKLIFSAKEAAYKAQYPISERLFGFDGFEISITEQTFIARFTTAVPGFAAMAELPGHWCFAGGHILTLVAIPA